jgi:SAM-dependent methyltransferase
MSRTGSDDSRLVGQYDAYPYPPRDPADEARRLIVGSPSQLVEINHYVFAGRRDFARPFRALAAGGGTGDAAIMMAQQLADSCGPGEVVHLDLSRAAQDVAAARARARSLTNIRFVRGSIADLGGRDLGRFDYIDCCGVLHHMADPAAGLAALAGALAPDGGMGLMVYAPLGRTGVYHAQAMLRMLADGADDPTRLGLARALLGQLPPTNWLRRNPYVGDHLQQGESGLYDLLLHSRDRACTVPDIAALVAGAGLRIVSFIEPLRYDPLALVREPELVKRLRALPWLERCAFAELLSGNMKTHVFYVVKAGNPADTVARADSPDVVPVPVGLEAIARGAAQSRSIATEFDGLRLSLPLPGYAGPILAAIDARRTLAEIHDTVRAAATPPPDWPAFKRAFDELFAILNGMNLLFLRRP